MNRPMGHPVLAIGAAPDRPFGNVRSGDSVGNSRVLPGRPRRSPVGSNHRTADSLPHTLRVLPDRRAPRTGPSAPDLLCSLAHHNRAAGPDLSCTRIG